MDSSLRPSNGLHDTGEVIAKSQFSDLKDVLTDFGLVMGPNWHES